MGRVGFPSSSVVKQSACNAGDKGDVVQFPWLGRSLGEGNGNPLQYSCQENPTEGGVWQATVHIVTKGWTQLSNACMDWISSRYLRFSNEQARWSHRLEEGEGLRDKTLVGSKERPLGRGIGPKPWTGNSLPFPDRGEDTPKEQQVWATKWWPVWLKFNDTQWDGKSLLGLTSCWVLLACLESLDFILQWRVIGKRQTEKWFT